MSDSKIEVLEVHLDQDDVMDDLRDVLVQRRNEAVVQPERVVSFDLPSALVEEVRPGKLGATDPTPKPGQITAKAESRTSRRKNRSLLVLGNVDGKAIIFYDPNDVTAKIRAIFADPTILKVQTGIEADIVLLPFRIFGLVDLGCFVPFFDSLIRNFSLTHLHEFVYPNGPFRVEWPFRTAMREYENETLHMIKDRNPRLNEALVHSLQDVFTPITAAFQIGSTTLFADNDRFPLINDLLELCWAKCPSGMALLKLSCKELWVSDDEVKSPPNRLNSQSEVQRVRAARQWFYETRPYDLTQAKAWAEQFCVEGLPKAEDVYLRDLRLRLWFNCQNCTSKSHKTEGCPLPPKVCQYPHRGVKYPQPFHSEAVCPALHAWCRICWIHGHENKLHGPRNLYTAGNLRRDFNRAAPFGKLTSPIFLRPDDAFGDRRSFFRAGLLSSNRVFASAETRLAGHIYEFNEAEAANAIAVKDEAVGALEDAVKAANIAGFVAKSSSKKKKK